MPGAVLAWDRSTTIFMSVTSYPVPQGSSETLCYLKERDSASRCILLTLYYRTLTIEASTVFLLSSQVVTEDAWTKHTEKICARELRMSLVSLPFTETTHKGCH